MSWLDFADLSDHGSVIVLQALKVLVGQQPSFSGMGHGSVQARDVHTDMGVQARDVHIDTGFVSEVGGCDNWQYSSLNFFHAIFT